MPQAADHHPNPDHTPGGPDAPLRAKPPWRAPLVISSTLEETEKFSIHSFEGGSYPTTHGPTS